MCTQVETISFAPFTTEGLNKAFRTALLLTGRPGQAETALLNAIGMMRCEEASDQSLFRNVLSAAIALGGEVPARADEFDHASLTLPPELRRVLRLPSELRYSFVLRRLLGFSRADCANLLHLSIREADERACAALEHLTQLYGTEVGEGVAA